MFLKIQRSLINICIRKNKMFLEKDEHILPFESTVYPFSIDDLKMMEDAGIKTIYVTHVFYWNQIQKQFCTDMDWSSVDARIEKYLHTNLKMMLPFYVTMPRWFPPDWYLDNTPSDDRCVIPNYANERFQIFVDRFFWKILRHYKDIRDRIHLTYAIPAGGEFPWDANLTNNFPISDEDLFQFVIDRQKFLSMQYGEVWSVFHNFLGDSDNWNNKHLPLLYEAMRKEFPDLPIYSIQGPHFSVGKKDYYTDEKNQRKVTEYTEKFGIKFFVGPDYCEGLKVNIEKAIEQKAYGFIIAPLGEENTVTHTYIEQWMADAMKKANDRFREIYG